MTMFDKVLNLVSDPKEHFNLGLHITRGAKQGGGLNPPEFWMGGLNTYQPPLILKKKFQGGGGWFPLN